MSLTVNSDPEAGCRLTAKTSEINSKNDRNNPNNNYYNSPLLE